MNRVEVCKAGRAGSQGQLAEPKALKQNNVKHLIKYNKPK